MDERVWRKSSFSGGNNGDCVEVAAARGDAGAAIRDSKNVSRVLQVGFADLVAAVKDDRLTR